MTKTLYRTHRPATFADVVGQSHVITTLKNQLRQESTAHAYLFAGPRGVGKTTTARLLAKALNCKQLEDGEPDNTCEICQSITAGTLLDLVEIDAASNRRVEEVRQLREHVQYPPNTARYKIFLIDEVHMLTTEAFNALLKTLEEPPAYAVFILATTEIGKLPDTIVSRCQRFDFRLLSIPELVERLQVIASKEDVVVSEDVLLQVAKLSRGSVRDAESIFGQVLSVDQKAITMDDVAAFLPRSNADQLLALWQAVVAYDAAMAMRAIQAAVETTYDLELFYTEWLELIRHALLLAIATDTRIVDPVLSEQQYQTVIDSLPTVSLEQLQQLLRVCLDCRAFMAVSPLPQLPLELAIIDYIHPIGKSVDEPTESVSPVIAANRQTMHETSPVPTEESQQSPTAARTAVTSEQSAQSGTDVSVATLPTTSNNTHTMQGEVPLQQWQQIQSQVKNQHSTIGMYLSTAQARIQGTVCTVVVAHEFHKDILNKPAYKQAVATTIQSVLGRDDLGVSIVAAATDATSAAEITDQVVIDPATAAAQAAEVLGGTVIEG